MKTTAQKILNTCFVALSLALVSPMAQSFTIDTSSTSTSPMTGLWNNENESGWGTAIIQQYGTMFVTMYTYDGNGNPVWYVASNCPVASDGCTGSLYKVAGGSSPTTTWNGANKAVTEVGALTLAFSDANTGTMNFTINGVSGSKAITRSVFATAPATNTADRICTGSMTDFIFNLTIHPSAGTITVSMTGATNTSLFAPYYLSLIQGSNSVTGTYSTSLAGVWWTGDDGFRGGAVPTGVTKTGTFSEFPSWFDFSQPFTVNHNITGERITC